MHICLQSLNVLRRSALSNARYYSDLRNLMRMIPQPVVVVTSSMVHPHYGAVKRGVTCSSFTSISLDPSTVSVSIYSGNLINSVIEKGNHFAANILSDRQVKLGMHFAKSFITELGYQQFEDIDHDEGIKGVPLLKECVGTLMCQVSKVDVIEDHYVWYGEVIEAMSNPDPSSIPMLYYQRSFRSIGDEIFMQAFEDFKLPFEEWTHEAHLRMAWNYITKYGQEEAIPYIRQGILRFNEMNKTRIKYGYSETVTRFYIHVITKAVLTMPNGHTFEDFLLCNQYLTDITYLYKYYSQSLLQNPESKHRFIEPDIQSLP